MVFSPSAARSMQARSDRPTSRLISWVRPPTRPLTDSRSERVWVAAGSMAYSAVSQPDPDPLRQRGTPSVTLAVHITRVWPNSMSTEPAGWAVKPRVIVTGRNSSSRRPSSRVDTRPTLVGGAAGATDPLGVADLEGLDAGHAAPGRGARRALRVWAPAAAGGARPSRRPPGRLGWGGCPHAKPAAPP